MKSVAHSRGTMNGSSLIMRGPSCLLGMVKRQAGHDSAGGEHRGGTCRRLWMPRGGMSAGNAALSLSGDTKA